MNDTLLMGVLHRLADHDKELKPSRDRKGVLRAELRNVNPFGQFHHEIRPAVWRSPGVEHLGHIRVFHQRQRLLLLLKARDHGTGVHPEFDDLQGYAAAHWLQLVCQPNNAEAPLANLAEQFVIPNSFSLSFRAGACKLRALGEGRAICGALHETAVVMKGKQLLDLSAQPSVALANTLKISGALVTAQCCGVSEDLFLVHDALRSGIAGLSRSVRRNLPAQPGARVGPFAFRCWNGN